MKNSRRASTGSFGETFKKQTSILSFFTKREARHSDESVNKANEDMRETDDMNGAATVNCKTCEDDNLMDNLNGHQTPIFMDTTPGVVADHRKRKADEEKKGDDESSEDEMRENVLQRKKQRQKVKMQLFDSDDDMGDAGENDIQPNTGDDTTLLSRPCTALQDSESEENQRNSTLKEELNEPNWLDSCKYEQQIDRMKKQDTQLVENVENNLSYQEKSNSKHGNVRVPLQDISNDSSSITNSKIDMRRKMMSSYAAINFPSFAEYIECYYMFCDTFSFPIWLDPTHIRDCEMKTPFDEEYDYSTLWIPPPYHKWHKDAEMRPHLTPGMLQYWEIKAKQLDRLVFFKMGRFYELFYIDACIAQRVCDLKWMGAEQKPHVGFPEQSLHHYAKKLLKEGYKVVVVEQMETPKELEERNKQTVGRKDKAVRREVCESFSQGTILHADMLETDAQYLMAIYFDDNQDTSLSFPSSTAEFGVCMVDVATCQFLFGHFIDEPSHLTLRTLLAQTCPSELLYNAQNTSTEVTQIIKNLPSLPQLSPLVDFPCGVAATVEFERYGEELMKIEAMGEIVKKRSVMNSFAAICRYLRKSLLDEKVMAFAKFEKYEPFHKRYMILDAIALRNLEVLQTNEWKSTHSLVNYLNRTSTAFGSRLFKRWVCSPLYNIREINRRLDCVEWFNENCDDTKQIRKKLSKLPDAERLSSHVCIKALQNERGAVYFENVHHKRLEEFLLLLDAFELMEEIVRSDIYPRIDSMTKFPERLKELVSLKEEGGIFPCVSEVTKLLRSRIDTSDKFKPKRGTDKNYDEIEYQIKKLNEKLEDELEYIKKKWKRNCFKFVHTKFKYEIECPEDVPEQLQRQVDITSTRKGFIRFHTKETKILIEEMEVAEQNLKDAIFPFMKMLFQEFYSHYNEYQIILRIIAEIDSLISLSMVCSTSVGRMCRPEFVEKTEVGNAFLDIRNCRHPIVALTLNNFVPNDTVINTEEIPASTLLVTGPNMGGKSTVLRQTCIAIIMAQMGGFVAADSCKLSPVDRIFTRVGANDFILEGKSTFFVELEETCTILKQATSDSFAIIDELGRGTSTFDGTAIAMAAVEYITNTLQCRCMFSTHFHLLCEEFRLSQNIRNFHMAAEVDEQHEVVAFLYKFHSGTCPKSHGIHVAKLAGLPQSILDCASTKSKDLEMITKEFNNLSRYRNIAQTILNCIQNNKFEELQLVYHTYGEEFRRSMND